MNEKTANYEDLISYFTRAYQHVEEESLKKLYQSFVKYWVDDVRKREGKEDSIYEEMLSKVDLSLKDIGVEKIDEKPLEGVSLPEETVKESLTETPSETLDESIVTNVTSDVNETNKENNLTDEKEKIEKYLQEYIFNDPKIKEEYDELKEKLGSDLENPNDVLIQTWVNNYKEFIRNYNLDEEIMFEHMEQLFVDIFGKEEWFSFAKDIYINENIVKKEETKSDEVPSLDDFEENIELDNNGVSSDSTETEMTENLDGDNKGVVPSDVSDESKKTEEADKGKNDTENEIPADALRIVSMEKPVDRISFREVTVKYLVPIALMVVSNSLIPLSLVWIAVAKFGTPVWNYIKEKYYQNNSVNDFLKEYDLISKKDGAKGFVLIDKKTGKTITKEDVGKERYEEIKQELIKIGAMDSNLFERFERVPVVSWMLKRVKGLVEKTKELVSSRKKYKDMCKIKKQLIKNATSSEEYYKYKNSRVENINNEFCLVDQEGNKIYGNIANMAQTEENLVEEVESKGRSK